MILTPRLILLLLLAFFVLCVLLVHLRGRVRLRFDRQLVDHSAVFAPYNLLMYAFSAVPARPILDRRGFPQLDLLQANWQAIRDEALQLFDEGHIRAAAKNDDASFNSFFKQKTAYEITRCLEFRRVLFRSGRIRFRRRQSR